MRSFCLESIIHHLFHIIFVRQLLTLRLLRSDLGCRWSLIKELLKTKEESQIGFSEIAQPATTAIQIALVDLLDDFGIVPQRVCGHSSGEIAAAYAAGALTHKAAIEMYATFFLYN